jgi:hypothetical protein
MQPDLCNEYDTLAKTLETQAKNAPPRGGSKKRAPFAAAAHRPTLGGGAPIG